MGSTPIAGAHHHLKAFKFFKFVLSGFMEAGSIKLLFS